MYHVRPLRPGWATLLPRYDVRNMNMRTAIIGARVFAAPCWADEPRFSVGSKNPALYEGARALYLDATEPVRPDIEIDDRSAEIP